MLKKTIILSAVLFSLLQLRAQHFQPVWQNPFNPMNIFVVEANFNGVDLDAGDEIGIFDIDPITSLSFCVGAVTLTTPASPGEFAQIICSMDDGTSPSEPNGFGVGNNFVFRYWIAATADEIEEAVVIFPYPGYDETFTPLGTAIVQLSASGIAPQTQSISLSQGWSGISSYLAPSNPDIGQITAAIHNNLIIIQNLDGAYYQPQGESTLTDWDYSQGYFVKMTAGKTLDFIGIQPPSSEIVVQEGWNLIPVLSSTTVVIEDLFAGNLDKIEIIKEAPGLRVYWPGKQIYTLQNLVPCKAYLLKANQEFSVSF